MNGQAKDSIIQHKKQTKGSEKNVTEADLENNDEEEGDEEEFNDQTA